jgi:hypothetical protein
LQPSVATITTIMARVCSLCTVAVTDPMDVTKVLKHFYAALQASDQRVEPAGVMLCIDEVVQTVLDRLLQSLNQIMGRCFI